MLQEAAAAREAEPQRTPNGSRLPDIDAADRFMMKRCVQLARRAVHEAEHPFASIIVRHGAVVAEATNHLRRQ